LVDKQRLKRFTKKELREFNGEEGSPSYVAFKEKVYDVSNSRLWKDGKHQGRHSAGNDLTKSVLNAPHSEEVLMKFQIVGDIFKEETSHLKRVQWLQKMHLHPISVHFSIAYSIAVPLLSVLYVLTGELSFETAAYYMLLFGFLSAPASVVSGFFSWKTTYEGRINSIFTRKIAFAAIMLVIITICFFWRTLNPNIIITGTDSSYIYLSLTTSLIPIATILGYYGGKIVYP
jgi:predicted heme/steroid binding protein/uncharacterized membrane protein